MDCIPDSRLQFCHAKLKSNGYIKITMDDNDYYDDDLFHKDMTLEEFDTPIFDSLEEAVEELPCYNGETFVMAFPKNQVCERLWFMPEQKDSGLTERLNKYKMCYGGYEYSIYKRK